MSKRYGNTQFRYALTYVIITFCVLLFLNIYTSGTSQKLFYQSKESSMIDKCLLVGSHVSNLEVLNSSTAAVVVSQMDSLDVSRLVITDSAGVIMYDSSGSSASGVIYALLPEIIQAMEGNNVFYWQYADSVMESRAATPVFSNGSIMGCVYMMEYDTEQGVLIRNLQQNIFTISLILELAVVIYSLVFSTVFSHRIRRILSSIRIISGGDYSHKVKMGGNDELTFLGDEFNDLTEKLQTSENKRRQFVSDASHELKTPLASIKLLTDSILQNSMDMDTVKEFVSDIGNEADRLNRMSEKLLSLSRIESQQDGDCEIVYMAPAVERAARMLSGTASANGIHIELDLKEDSPILVLEDDLYQIIFNLMENGIKYNTPGGTITASLERQADNAILMVSDTGVGIPEEALSHVFERFFRVDKARSRNSGGSGLGLSIVRSIVERNQGEIHVESTVGKGSVFTVSFPVFETDEEVQEQ